MAEKYLVVKETSAGLALVRKSADEISESVLHFDDIDDTTQTIVFADDGTVSQIVHERDGAVIRTDSFTFSDNEVVEEREDADGNKLTLTTNLTTLVTTVVYTAA